MATPGNFTTLAASGAVTLPLGAQTGYLWQCSNAGTGACGWVALASVSPTGALTVSSADANLSVTLGGTPSTALLAAASIGVNWSGLLPVSRGGLGIGSCVSGDVFYGSGANTIAALPANATASRKFLMSVSGGTPVWDVLQGGDIGNITTQFSSAGFGTSAPTNSYITTTNRTALAGANYQISLAGIYTGINGTTNITDLDITTTHTAGTGGIATSANIALTPNTNATTATITSSYGLLINGGTNTGGTVTNAYGIYVSAQNYGTANIGIQLSGTYTGSGDKGLILSNIFTPTSTANLYQLFMFTFFNTSSAAITESAGIYGYNRFNVNTNNATTIANLKLEALYNISSTGTVTDAMCAYIVPTINVTTSSTGTRVTNMSAIKIQPASGPVISTLSTTIGSYYNIYSGTMPSLAGSSGKFGTVYGGYFAAPLTTTTDASTGSVALFADSLQVGGSVTTTATPGTIRVGAVTGGIICASAALATNATVGFLYGPSCAGTPSVPPTPITTGTIPTVYDSTNNIVYMYNGAWKTMPFSSSGTSTVNSTGPNGFISSITYRYKVIGGVLCSVYLPDNLTNWSGGAGTNTISFTGSGNPAPTLPAGSTQRFTVQTYQNNVGNIGFLTITNSNLWTFYLTITSGNFTGNQAVTGTIATTITYIIS